MKKAILQRIPHEKVTFGFLSFENINHRPIYTIELPWRNNQCDISCISQGLYNVTPYNSKRFPGTFEILHVPGRSAILIHSGNFACDVNISASKHKTDTEGCVLVGFEIETKLPMVGSSKLALEYLREVVAGENFSLQIKNW